MTKEDAVQTGAITGLGFATASNMEKAGEAKRRANRAIDKARDVETSLTGLQHSGFWLRLMTAQVSDMLAGLCYPGQTAESEPSPFGSSPATIARPDIPESAAIAPDGFPIATNRYDGRGFLVTPDNATVGELFYTGLSLTHPSVRAAVMGLAHEGEQPSADQLAQTYRFFSTLESTLRGKVTPSSPGGLTVEQYTAIWNGIFGSGSAAGGCCDKILFNLLEDAGAFNNTTAETVMLNVPLKWGAIPVGRSARLTAQLWAPTASGTNEVVGRIRFNGVAGAVLVASTSRDLGNAGDGFGLGLTVTRRANDATGSAIYAVGGSASNGPASTPTKLISVAPGNDAVLSITGTWDTAAIANVLLTSQATFELI